VVLILLNCLLSTVFQSTRNFIYVVNPNCSIARKQKAEITNTSHYEYDVWLLQNAVVRGTLLGLQYMGKDKGGKGGVVVNIASILGLAPLSGSPVYVATKHAVIGLTRSFGVSTAYNGVLNFFVPWSPFRVC
jgi:NAD(P)-dependent dehydrogenase (short-subunit alcohol dehydrogenase family)